MPVPTRPQRHCDPASLVTKGIIDWMKQSDRMDDSKSYYDRETDVSVARVRQMLKEKQFGLFWGEEGDFTNLDGNVMDAKWET